MVHSPSTDKVDHLANRCLTMACPCGLVIHATQAIVIVAAVTIAAAQTYLSRTRSMAAQQDLTSSATLGLGGTVTTAALVWVAAPTAPTIAPMALHILALAECDLAETDGSVMDFGME